MNTSRRLFLGACVLVLFNSCSLLPEHTVGQAKREEKANDANARGIFHDYDYDSNGNVRPYSATGNR